MSGVSPCRVPVVCHANPDHSTEALGGAVAQAEEEHCTSDMYFCAGNSGSLAASVSVLSRVCDSRASCATPLDAIRARRLASRGVVVFWAQYVLDSATAGLRVAIAGYVLDGASRADLLGSATSHSFVPGLFTGHPDPRCRPGQPLMLVSGTSLLPRLLGKESRCSSAV